MKKNILLTALLLLFASCEKETPELEVSTSSIFLPAEAGNATFHISTNKKWNIAMPETWCQSAPGATGNQPCYAVNSDFWSSLSAYSGKNSKDITLFVTENPSYYNRYCDFEVTAENLSKQIYVQQRGKPYLEIEHPHYEIEASTYFVPPGFEIMVDIYENDFEVKSNTEWIDYHTRIFVSSQADGRLKYRLIFSVNSNLSPTPREAILTFTQGSLSKTVTVRQAGAE